MDSLSNFKRPKRRHSSRASIDGIIPIDGFKKRSSVDFGRTNPEADQSTAAVGDFNRPDGFQPGVQPLIHTSDTTFAPSPAKQTPRRRKLWPSRKKKGRRHLGGKPVQSKRRKIVKRSILVFLAILIGIGVLLGWKFYHNASKIFHGSPFGLFEHTKLKGEDKGRVNILLTGNSEDDPGHAGADLTDSIMVISIDTVNNNGFILSIPRDLWVDYGTSNCSFGYKGKINAVYKCGEEVKFREKGFPDGGIGLLEKVVERDFGLDINYYTKINYGAFKDAVNAVRGIDVTIKTDDPRGLYDGNIAKVDGGPLKLSNGLQHLNGQTALNLARARCDTVCYGYARGDFDRTEHQRQMLLALKDKASSAGVLSNPTKLGGLLDAAGNNVKTDFNTSEVRRLYELAKLVNNKNVQSIGLADDNVNLMKTAPIGNSSAVVPVAGVNDFSQIKAYIKRLTSSDPVVKENATVVVLNASGTAGLAQKKADELKAKGLTVKVVSNAATLRPTSVIFSTSSTKSATKSYLERLFKTAATSDLVANPEAKNYQADFVIILGSDQN